jgi:ferredoxin-NADP reductase
VAKLAASDPLTTRLTSRQWLAPGILEFRLHKPSGFGFIPGQFVRFMMDGYQRDYTMVSDPNDETIDFCLAVVDKGRFSTEIVKADIGAAFQVSRPLGHFIYQGEVNPAVFVATGTGVAPFVAFCRSGVRDALLLHGASSPGRLVYRDLLEPALRGYIPCIRPPDAEHSKSTGIYSGRVTDYLQEQLEPGTYDFYLCGRRSMIRDATAIIDRRFGESRLFIETYD